VGTFSEVCDVLRHEVELPHVEIYILQELWVDRVSSDTSGVRATPRRCVAR
jgi:hypothetical protein